MTLYIIFIDFSKVFDLVNRNDLFQLRNISRSLQVLGIIISFQENTQSVASYNGENSVPFTVRTGVKQQCVLASILFDVFISMLQSFAVRHSFLKSFTIRHSFLLSFVVRYSFLLSFVVRHFFQRYRRQTFNSMLLDFATRHSFLLGFAVRHSLLCY